MPDLEDKIRGALFSFVSIWDQDDAIDPVSRIFDDVVTTLRRDRRFKSVSRIEFDLLLADARRRAEQDLGDRLHDTVDVDEAVCVIARELK
jgi:hypothetical protein